MLMTFVSVLFNEPKLLKSLEGARILSTSVSFSALQRAEIAEIQYPALREKAEERFSALQRAEIAEIRNRQD